MTTLFLTLAVISAATLAAHETLCALERRDLRRRRNRARYAGPKPVLAGGVTGRHVSTRGGAR